jgi:hypothetical protein
MAIDSLQTALQPVFQTPELNRPITLFEGDFALYTEDNVTIPCSGIVQWRWLPEPKLVFEANQKDVLGSGLHNIHKAFHSPKTQIHIPDIAPLQAQPTNLELMGGNMTGRLRGLYRPAENIELTELTFHIPNFPDYSGRAIKTGPYSGRAGRLVLQAAGWEILIDNLPDTDKLIKLLEANSGYAITHVGSLKRVDAAPFYLEESEILMEYLSFYLCFLTGRWSPPILWVGQLITEQRKAFITPANIRLGQWSPAQSWCNIKGEKVFEDIEPLFASFVEKFISEPELFRLSISWYLEVLSDKLVSDTRIILVQAALELLGLSLPPLIGKKPFGKAEDRIRNLFTLFAPRAPLAVPTSLPNLTAILTEEPAKNWNKTKSGVADIPSVIVSARNLIAHPAHKPADKKLLRNFLALHDISQLGVWYLEVVLLSWLNYSGHYNLRLQRGGWVHRGEVFPS